MPTRKFVAVIKPSSAITPAKLQRVLAIVWQYLENLDQGISVTYEEHGPERGQRRDGWPVTTNTEEPTSTNTYSDTSTEVGYDRTACLVELGSQFSTTYGYGPPPRHQPANIDSNGLAPYYMPQDIILDGADANVGAREEGRPEHRHRRHHGADAEGRRRM